MKSITSSLFGKLFGNSTEIIIQNSAITIQIGKTCEEVSWLQLDKPPVFEAGLFGQTMTFSSTEKNYRFSKLAYSCAKNVQPKCEQLWVETHKNKLAKLLSKVEKFINSRYLRESTSKQIKQAINREYKRWFPWSEEAILNTDIVQLLDKLSYYQHWQEADIKVCRESYITKQLTIFTSFFDSVESKPLTEKQRRACIIDDDNNLLLAGAGTGKTSVMVGRAGYLLNSGQAIHENILLLAYGRKAANEMDERIKQKLGTDKISASTFHKLGLSIIAKVEGAKPNISLFAEDEKAKSKWVQACFEQLITTHDQYRHLVLEYFSQYYYVEKSHFEFESLGDYYQYLTDNDIRTLKGEQVKSFAELYIANWLFKHGVEYQYEAKYAIDVKTVERKQYQPDFFLPELNIYIEYYGIDENGDTAPYIDREDYHASMHWKAQTHLHNNTRCINLSYALHKSGTLLSSLEQSLSTFSVDYHMLPDEVMLANLKESGRITQLAEIFTKLVGLVKAACLDEDSQQQLIANSLDATQMSKAFELLEPILSHYQVLLTSRDEIDFEDMISKALTYIESGQFNSPWRYIMVDEFQDISESRARLVKALRDNHKGCSVFAVGDDWQAIYRFSGADVSLTTNFESYFGTTTKSTLDKTFRFNNRIGDVASEFICKNPSQITKTIHSVKQVDKPAVSILRKSVLASTAQKNELIDEVNNGGVDDVLKAISNRVNKPVTVYLLARNWFQLPNKTAVAQLNRQYALLNIETQSFHASKGKEADFVVVVGLKSGKHGFPSNKASPAIIEALLAKQEPFEHAEQRRLFYVALTRAKQRVYLIADMIDSSDFVKQLIEDYDVELNEFAISVKQTFVDKIKCLICETGTLKPRKGRFGLFYSCSHFPRCDHKERGCVKCDSIMTKTKHSGFKSCLNPNCNEIVPTCNKCGAEMVLRKSQKGEFWGCRNFKGNEIMSCKNAIDTTKMQWPS